ncbi:MAG: class IIb bacteriocin, lactobin A/cerein 7B family [Butyrivibrio sp.]|nr:class IIb bacteriocin, lactobin A/cerein 7B family [Butyrivibrio sp.]
MTNTANTFDMVELTMEELEMVAGGTWNIAGSLAAGPDIYPGNGGILK